MAKKQKDTTSSSYTAKDIFVLKGLEPVRKRPGMYIGSTGPDGLHHLIWEVFDNCLDEAMGGYCSDIDIILMKDNRVLIADNGRGIPVEKHPDTGKSTLETVMTTLHAGGKFGGDAYKVSGGLHGVGVSVVCALSKYVRAEVCRDGFKWAQEYSRGDVKTKVEKVGPCKKTGTTIIFEPDKEIFKDNNCVFDLKRILSHLRQQAYLTSSVKISVRDERADNVFEYKFYFEGGLKSYVRYLVGEAETRHSNIFYCKGEKEDVSVEVSLQYLKEFECLEESFANNIYTGEGGMHLTGFRTALTRTINDYARKNGFLKEKDENLTGNDVREGLVVAISVKIRETQFEGQTKAKLGNPEAKTAVEAVMGEMFTDFLEKNPQDGRAIVETCLLSARARKAAKAARTTVLRKGVLDGLSLPGKLADCISKQASESELYIVEGDSAGGSSKMARNRKFQAILPLRGKILNVERARMDRILSSEEIKHLIIAMGTAIAQDFNIENLRYHRIIIMSDADVDGAHIRTLLLTLFFRHFNPLITNGNLYIAQPPLYQIKKGTSMKWAYDEEEKSQIIKEFGGKIEEVEEIEETEEEDKEEEIKDNEEKQKTIKINVQRYKGLGEMNADQLWSTTMDPKKRIVKQVTIEDVAKADKIFDMLMGGDVLPRKYFIQTHAKKVENLDI